MSTLLNEYDVIVIGAGPAGSMAAKISAEAGLNVLLIEKRQEIGTPIRCAEGISKNGLEKLFQVDQKWICAEIQKYVIHAPDDTAFSMILTDTGYILDRKIFDRDLANMAAQAGSQVLAKTSAYGLLTDEKKRVIGANISFMGANPIPVRAKIIIGADGVESQVGRWAGINTIPRLSDMYSSAQYLLAGIDIKTDTCDFYFGSKIAPGGYLWVFPKGNKMANVGLGMVGNIKNLHAIALLDEFIKRMFPHSSILGVVVGGIPLGGTLKELVKDGLMLVGDAAHQAYPHTGAGIQNALEAGMLAGQVASDAIAEKDCSAQFLSGYKTLWEQSFGKRVNWSIRIKKLASSLSDDTLNRSAALLARCDEEPITTKKVIFTVFKDNPKLLIELRHMFV